VTGWHGYINIINGGWLRSMQLLMDEDVKAVAEFMQERIAAGRLVAVAGGLSKIAPLIWGQYPTEEISALCLRHEAISGCGQPKPPSSTV
jgi:hypothetical protein